MDSKRRRFGGDIQRGLHPNLEVIRNLQIHRELEIWIPILPLKHPKAAKWKCWLLRVIPLRAPLSIGAGLKGKPKGNRPPFPFDRYPCIVSISEPSQKRFHINPQMMSTRRSKSQAARGIPRHGLVPGSEVAALHVAVHGALGVPCDLAPKKNTPADTENRWPVR